MVVCTVVRTSAFSSFLKASAASSFKVMPLCYFQQTDSFPAVSSAQQPGITCELVKNADCWALFQTYWLRNSGSGPRDLYVLMGFPRDSDAHSSLETTETDYAIHQTEEILRVVIPRQKLSLVGLVNSQTTDVYSTSVKALQLTRFLHQLSSLWHI